MKKFFLRTLEFFRLIDKNSNLSLSNVAVMVLIFKIAYAATIDWTAVAGLMLALLNYSYKRHNESKTPKVDDSVLQEAIIEIKDDIAKVKKIADDAKDKASKIAIASGIVTKKVGE